MNICQKGSICLRKKWNNQTMKCLELPLENNQKQDTNLIRNQGAMISSNVERSKEAKLNVQLDEYMSKCISDLRINTYQLKHKILEQSTTQNHVEERTLYDGSKQPQNMLILNI